MSLKSDLISITLDDQDEPVLSFSVTEDERTLEHKLLGALIRKIARQGLELHLVRTYPNAEEKPIWDYQIRAKRPDDAT